jgi:hypothetical protein
MDPFATRRLGKTELQLPLFGYGARLWATVHAHRRPGR